MLFRSIFSGVARELIEAVTGFFAVVTLTLVGIWLHRSSSLASWQAYIDRQLAAYQRTGRLWTLFGVSFLAVFREGAETILFLVGILSKISLLLRFVPGEGQVQRRGPRRTASRVREVKSSNSCAGMRTMPSFPSRVEAVDPNPVRQQQDRRQPEQKRPRDQQDREGRNVIP